MDVDKLLASGYNSKLMDSVLARTLTLLTLSQTEVKVFISSFKLGPSTIPLIGKAARVKRSTAYLVVKELIEKGYMLESYGKYANKVQTIGAEELQTKLAAKQRKLRRQEIEFQENIGAIQSIYQSSEVMPKVRTYKGSDGLLSIWNDILSTKDEILLWTNQKTENLFFGPENHNKFIMERIAKKIKIRVLATNSTEAKILQKKDSFSLRTTKILPRAKNFSAEIYIYDNKVAMLDFNKDTIGIIIESSSISQSYKSLFEIMWNSTT